MVLIPRIGRSRRFSGAWSASTRLFAYRSDVVPCRGHDQIEDARIGRRAVGDDLRRCHTGDASGALEEPTGRLAVPSSAGVHVDDLPVLVDRPVQIHPPPGDLDVGLVHVPAVADPVPTEPGRVGQSGANRRTQRCTVT
jgi:hypothetical protein